MSLELERLLKESKTLVDAMTPEQKEEMYRKQREIDDRERELLMDQVNDPRRKTSLSWIEPLIKEDE